ncbi:major capsid protein [Ralstonia sp. UBA689]|uniref:major capsid protein n=1 Tax=Ralstonia sp. UBA689 TaxID=1947373 RepID=UPI0025EBD5DD|nr:major capsid protein [Ralstonia sp. UBA689]
MKSIFKKVGFAVGTVGVAGSAMAADGVDVSAVVTTLGTGVAAIGLIGVAILGLAAVVAIYNWVRKPIK